MRRRYGSVNRTLRRAAAGANERAMTADPLPALVLGASRGLGAAMAEALAPVRHVVAVARTEGALEELDDRIREKGGSATLAPMDVTDVDAMAHLCRSVFDRWGGIALWVHAAVHAPPLSPADHVDEKDWSRAMETNAFVVGRLIPMISPLLGGGGQAVFFDDPHQGEKFFGAYAASKSAQIALVRAWAAETERAGPRIRILAPNPMPTATRARFFPGESRAPLASPASEARRLLGMLAGAS